MSPAPRASIISPDGGPATVETGRNRNGSRPIIRNGKYLHKRGESPWAGGPRGALAYLSGRGGGRLPKQLTIRCVHRDGRPEHVISEMGRVRVEGPTHTHPRYLETC
ncbi:hypothetical protein MTP99_011480 [Tenebrio molitor]|jgi:hypothetical protein|nr:hypothetical protein MTP99_011480 [Tenebrio molitor]